MFEYILITQSDDIRLSPPSSFFTFISAPALHHSSSCIALLTLSLRHSLLQFALHLLLQLPDTIYNTLLFHYLLHLHFPLIFHRFLQLQPPVSSLFPLPSFLLAFTTFACSCFFKKPTILLLSFRLNAHVFSSTDRCTHAQHK